MLEATKQAGTLQLEKEMPEEGCEREFHVFSPQGKRYCG